MTPWPSGFSPVMALAKAGPVTEMGENASVKRMLSSARASMAGVWTGDAAL